MSSSLPAIVARARQQFLVKERESLGMGGSEQTPYETSAASSASSSPSAPQSSKNAAASAAAAPAFLQRKSLYGVAPTIKAEMNYVVTMIKGRHLDEFVRWVRLAEDLDSIMITDQSGNTPLHWAANKGQSDMVAVLVRRGADINRKNQNGATPLHCAAFSGDSNTLEILIKAGAHLFEQNDQMKTFIDVCRSRGHHHLEPLLKDITEEARAQAVLASQQQEDDDTGSNLGVDDSIQQPNWLAPTPAKLSRAELLERLQQHQMRGGGVAGSSSNGNSSSSNATGAAAGGNGGGTGTVSSSGGGSPTGPQHRSTSSSMANYSVDTSALIGARGHGGDVNRTQPVRLPSPDIRLPPVSGASSSASHYASASSLPSHTSHKMLDQQILQRNQEINQAFVGVPRRQQAASQPAAVSPSKHPAAGLAWSNGGGVAPAGGASTGKASAASSGSSGQSILPSGTVVGEDVVVPQLVACCACDGEKNQASWLCDDCRQLDAQYCCFCNVCWAAEHSSRRTKGHRQSRIVVVAPPLESFLGGSDAMLRAMPLDLNQLSAEAKAFILLQQQMLAILNKNTQPAPPPPPVQTTTTSSQTLPPAQGVHSAAQTNDEPRHPSFSDALLELQDIREQLEAEVFHSQSVIDTVRLQMMEALELKHRAEVESMFWRKLLNFKRPPTVLILQGHQSIPSHLQHMPKQFVHGPPTASQKEQVQLLGQQQQQIEQLRAALATALAAADGGASGPVRPRRAATNNQGIQCVIRPKMAVEETQTDSASGPPPGTGSPPKPPVKQGAVPAYHASAVELVYGEKHLPGQPQMLLVRWTGGAESWVPAYEVSQCDAVVAYLSRYDKSVNTADSPILGRGRAASPLDDDERNDVMRQLAMLQRIGTANGSREGPIGVHGRGKPLLSSFSSPPAAATAAVAVPSSIADNPVRLPPLAAAATAGDETEPVVPPQPMLPQKQKQQQQQPTPPPAAAAATAAPPPPAAVATPQSDEALLRQYEAKLRTFEDRHNALRKSREDATEHMKKLSEKQQLTDVKQRAKVHVEYESQAPVLAAMQPDLPHPLNSTNERHAALVLQKLQEEVSKVESQHVHRKRNLQQQQQQQQPSPDSSQLPVPPAGTSTNTRGQSPPQTAITQPPRNNAGEQSVPPQPRPHALKPPALVAAATAAAGGGGGGGSTGTSPSRSAGNSPGRQLPPPYNQPRGGGLDAAAANANKLLYEQYFYKKAGGESPSRQDPLQQQQQPSKPPHYVMSAGSKLQAAHDTRPALLN